MFASARHAALIARNYVRRSSTQSWRPTSSEFSMFRSKSKPSVQDAQQTKMWKQPSKTGLLARTTAERKMYKLIGRVRIGMHPDPDQLRYMRLFARSGINCW
jgi:predicted trehalose synthase